MLGVGAALALALPAAACGIQPTGITALGPAPAALTGSPPQSADAGAGSGQFLVYFYQDERLAPAYRPSSGSITEDTVLKALIDGPDRTEQAAGFTTEVPASLRVKIRAGGLFGAYGIDQVLTSRAKAQFICTMQYYNGTISVGIQLAGSATVNWNSCSDTTNQYIPMRVDQTPSQ
ncbi:MAG: hypothetical protein ACRDVE_22220 [Actinocrinis sp.]